MIIFFLIILGILLTSYSIFLIIIYSNLLYLGYNFFEYGYFIIRKPCFYSLILGIILLIVALERVNKSELLLRRKVKFFK